MIPIAKKRKNGESTLRLRKDGRWEGRIVVGYNEKSLPITKCVTAKTKTECSTKLEALKEQYGRSSDRIKADMPFGDWIDFWYQTYCRHTLRITTRTDYENRIYNHIIPEIGKIPLNRLSQSDLQQFYAKEKTDGRKLHAKTYGKGLSNRTIRAIHANCRTALQRAVQDGLIRTNPAVGCKLPPKKAREMQVLTQNEILRFLHQAKEDLYIEREKLITHLQISHEGLGVFNHRKEEILVNNLFTQYANLISDKNLSSTEEIFSIPELQPITRFITKNKERSIGKEEKRMSLNIDKNGRIFAVECIIFQDDSFEISINDITQEKEQALLKKQLTQNIAHELKTPVSSIQGYLETIVNNPTLPREKINAFLERSYAQSNRLAHLLRDISVLTRMEEAPNMIETEPVNLTTMMRNILNEVTLELEEKQITAHNMLPEGLTVQGNSSLLYSIFRNLTDNAIAYAGTHISITIRCFREDERFYYFSFSDTGVGVGPEHLSRLFERFYRVDKGRSRKLGGTGLGLAIVKNAVILHGGTIFAKNTPGGGLEFIFTLSKE